MVRRLPIFLDTFRKYVLIGGMSKIASAFAESRNFYKVKDGERNNRSRYEVDFLMGVGIGSHQSK